MGMMNVMRDRMHVILWFLLIMFLGSMTVGGLVGGADIINQLLGKTDVRKAIAVVNGQIIAPEEFHHQLNHRLEQMRAQGQEIDDRQLDQIRNGLLDELVEFTLIDQQIKERNIHITDDDVYYHLLNSPPAAIQRSKISRLTVYSIARNMSRHFRIHRLMSGAQSKTSSETICRDRCSLIRFGRASGLPKKTPGLSTSGGI